MLGAGAALKTAGCFGTEGRDLFLPFELPAKLAITGSRLSSTA